MSCSQSIIVDNEGKIIDNLKFHCRLPDTLTFAIDQKYCIALKSLHVSHRLCNISKEQHQFSVVGNNRDWKVVKFEADFFCNSIEKLLSKLNEANKRFNAVMRFRLTENGKVNINIAAQNHQINLSEPLAVLLGFDRTHFHRDNESDPAANIAENESCLFHNFHKIYLLAPELVDRSVVAHTRMPLLRMFTPALELLEKYGIIEVDFLDEHYYTLFPTTLTDCQFQFLDCNFEPIIVDKSRVIESARFSAQIDRRPILFNL